MVIWLLSGKGVTSNDTQIDCFCLSEGPETLVCLDFIVGDVKLLEMLEVRSWVKELTVEFYELVTANI